MRREKMGFELFQEGLPLLLNNGIVGRVLGCSLHPQNGRGNCGRNPRFAVAGRADLEIGGIIKTAV